MGCEPVVVDVSSDDEDDVLTNWIDELLDGKEEDPNDIVLLDQFVKSVEIPEAKSKSIDDSDDDCLILDGDPDKPVEVKDGSGGGGDGSDDLLIVGEKGEIACRDYPHSRNLCASFPFGATPHEKHCSLCHCYVCDTLAPCVHWGNGDSLAHHCHASDKVETWKLQRKLFQRAKTTTLPKEKEKLSNPTPRMIPVPVRNPVPIPVPVSASLLTRPSILNPPRPCSAPCVPGQRHHQRPPVIPILQPHSKFKRPGIPRPGLISSSTNRSHYNASGVNQFPPMPQRPPYPQIRPVLQETRYSQQQAVTAQSVRYNAPSINQHRPVSQNPHYPQKQAITSSSRGSQHTLLSSYETHLENSVKNLQDILSGVASKLGVSISDSTPMVQPYAVSSQCPSFGSQTPHQINPADLDCGWLDCAVLDQGPPVQPAESTASSWKISGPAGNGSDGM